MIKIHEIIRWKKILSVTQEFRDHGASVRFPRAETPTMYHKIKLFHVWAKISKLRAMACFEHSSIIRNDSHA